MKSKSTISIPHSSKVSKVLVVVALLRHIHLRPRIDWSIELIFALILSLQSKMHYKRKNDDKTAHTTSDCASRGEKWAEILLAWDKYAVKQRGLTRLLWERQCY